MRSALCSKRNIRSSEYVIRFYAELRRRIPPFRNLERYRLRRCNRKVSGRNGVEYDGCIAARTLVVVRYRHRYVESISRRGESRSIRHDDVSIFYLRRRLCDADRIGRHRNGHNAEASVEVIGNAVREISLLRSRIDDARPISDRLVLFSLKRIQIVREQIVVFAAACRSERTEDIVFGQNQIEHLRRRNFERALFKKVCKRIGRFIARNLQNAFVDRHDDDFSRPLTRIRNSVIGSGLGFTRNVERDFVCTPLEADRKRNGRIAEGTHVDFFGVVGARVHDRDIAVSFNSLRNRNRLQRGCTVGTEPFVCIYFIAFDCDETASGVRRFDKNLCRVSGTEIAFFHLYFEFRSTRQASLQILFADNGIRRFIKFETFSVFQRQRKIAFIRNGQPIFQSRFGDRKRFCKYRIFFFYRLIFIRAVRLFDEHGHVAGFRDGKFDSRHRSLFEIGTDCDECQFARRILFDVRKIAVGFYADEIFKRGNVQRRLRRDRATAAFFVTVGRKGHAIRRFGEFFDIDYKLRPSFIVGRLFVERFRI